MSCSNKPHPQSKVFDAVSSRQQAAFPSSLIQPVQSQLITEQSIQFLSHPDNP